MTQCMPVNSPNYKPVKLNFSVYSDSPNESCVFRFPEDHGFRDVEFIACGPETLKDSASLLLETVQQCYGNIKSRGFRELVLGDQGEYRYSFPGCHRGGVSILIRNRDDSELSLDQSKRKAQILMGDVLDYLFAVGVDVVEIPLYVI